MFIFLKLLQLNQLRIFSLWNVLEFSFIQFFFRWIWWLLANFWFCSLFVINFVFLYSELWEILYFILKLDRLWLTSLPLRLLKTHSIRPDFKFLFMSPQFYFLKRFTRDIKKFFSLTTHFHFQVGEFKNA